MATTPTTEQLDVDADESADESRQPLSGGGKTQRKVIVVGDNNGLRIESQNRNVVITGAPTKIRARSKVTITGFELSVYNEVQLIIDGKAWLPIQLHLAVRREDPITFYVPDFNLKNVVADGTPVWVQLSSQVKEANATISPYLVYSTEEEDEDQAEEEESKKIKESAEADKSNKGEGAFGAPGDPTGIMMNATDTAVKGIVGAFLSRKVQNRDKLKDSLKSGNKKDIEAAIKEAKRLGDTKGLKEALKQTENREYLKMLNDALIVEDGKFTPKEATEANIKASREVDLSDDDDSQTEIDARASVETETEVSGTSTVSQTTSIEQNGGVNVSGEVTSQINTTAQGGGGGAEVRVEGTQQGASSGTASVAGKETISSTISGGGASGGAQGTASAEVNASSQTSGGGSVQSTGSSTTTINTQSSSGAGSTINGSVSSQTQPTGQQSTAQKGDAGSVNVSGSFNTSANLAAGAATPASAAAAAGSTSDAQVSEASPKPNQGDIKKPEAKSETKKDAPADKPLTSTEPQKPPAPQNQNQAGQNLPAKGVDGAAGQKKSSTLKDSASENIDDQKNKPLPVSSRAKKQDVEAVKPSAAIAKMLGNLTEKGKVLDGLRKSSGSGRKNDPTRPSGVDGVKPTGGAAALGQGREDGKKEQDQQKEKSEQQSGNINQPSKPQPNSQVDDLIPSKSETAPAIPTPKTNQQNTENDTDANEQDDDNNESAEPSETDINLAAQRQALMAAAVKKKKLDEAISAATKAISLAMNSALMTGAVVIWVAAAGTLGLAAIPGALVADAIAVFKNPIIKFFVNRALTTPELKEQSQRIAEEIKFSRAVKLNIFALNLISFIIIVLIVLVSSIINGLCRGLITGITASAVGFGDVCKAAAK